jgi:hypothetical protein
MASKSGQLQSRHNATLFAHVLFDHYTSPDGSGSHVDLQSL